MNRLPLLLLTALFLWLPTGNAFATDESEDDAVPKTPYFAAIAEEKAYIRFGPGKDYPIKWIYRKKGMPVEITHTYESWRKIKLADGEFGWVNRTLLTSERTVLLQGQGEQKIYKDADLTEPVARAMPGLILTLEKCDRTACKVEAGKIAGWVERKLLWGIYADEQIP